MKQTIDLMKPRYKVIAEDTSGDWTKDNIITFEEDFMQRPVYYLYDDEGKRGFKPGFFDGYPHLFKPLQWWEERKPEEMPRYVAHKLGGYYEVFQWHKNSVGVWRCDVQIALFFIGDIVPISETEYNSYLKSKP